MDEKQARFPHCTIHYTKTIYLLEFVTPGAPFTQVYEKHEAEAYKWKIIRRECVLYV